MQSINHNAPVKCSKSIIINCQQEKVWQILTKINDWPLWHKDISQARLNGELKPNATFKWTTGGVTIHSALHTVEPYKFFGWTGKTFGMRAIHNWSLTSHNGGTQVTVDESMEGLLAMIFKKYFNKNLENGMQQWLDLMKQLGEKQN